MFFSTISAIVLAILAVIAAAIIWSDWSPVLDFQVWLQERRRSADPWVQLQRRISFLELSKGLPRPDAQRIALRCATAEQLEAWLDHAPQDLSITGLLYAAAINPAAPATVRDLALWSGDSTLEQYGAASPATVPGSRDKAVLRRVYMGLRSSDPSVLSLLKWVTPGPEKDRALKSAKDAGHRKEVEELLELEPAMDPGLHH